jgi:ABC-type maltose transport system permease subunit
MKQKDIAMIIIMIFISALGSFFVSRLIVTSPENRSEKVEVVDKISSEFKQPNSKYFNSNSINPTKLIQIGDNPNPTPFQ